MGKTNRFLRQSRSLPYKTTLNEEAWNEAPDNVPRPTDIWRYCSEEQLGYNLRQGVIKLAAVNKTVEWHEQRQTDSMRSYEIHLV